MKTVLITTEFKRIDKRRWPKYVRDFIDNPDVNSIHPESGSKIAYHRFNTEAFPRLVFMEEKSEGNTVYVIRKYFNEHRDYDEFRKLDEKQRCQKCKYSPLDEEDLAQELSRFVEEEKKEALPIEMRNFEKTRDFTNTATTYVFEMEEWCSHLRNRDLEDDKKEIFDAVQRIVIEKGMTNEDADGWRTINFAGDKEIVYRLHEHEGHIYYYIFDVGTHVDISSLRHKYIDLSDIRLLKQARKGFPDWILYGEFEDWKSLENDDEANLALSDEEIVVLNKTPYPYFVNGLAGSGKSTILYYLFAHAYSYKEVKPMDLIFLSYSPKLITKAKSVIKALLRRNPSYHEFKLTPQEEQNLDSCFWSFREFLTNSFLDKEDEITMFSSSNHLSYEQFQKDYNLDCKLNEARTYTAAMVWSVIRSFIKGRDYKSTFTIEDYQKLRDSERTVDVADYENIYKIWKNWYKPTYEGKRWDDLDLVQIVLKKLDTGIDFKKYDIIYCDEAQDFTMIENDLILRLSKYASYDLNGYHEIPIAYAGDPNQTVNPTGFNWKRLKDIFDKTFSELVGNHISLNEKTLNNNYRSKKTIVEFANSIQYIRKCFLSDDVIKPQEQWNPQSNPLPGFFFLSRADGIEDDKITIETGFSKTECIITGAEGEYERKLDDKNELTEDSTSIEDDLLASIDNKGKLYTAISSKGLEFKAVLLYRFADQLPLSFDKMLAKEESISESDKYELAHFFTKLYIAVSRAKEVLYIADTQENYERFWKYFLDNSFVNELLQKMPDAAAWVEKVGGIELGDKSEFLSRMAENFNPLETALRIFDDAKLDRSAKDMKRAAGYFEEAGEYTKAREAKAYVLLFEQQYLKAGKQFRDLGMTDIATNAFWQGRCWDELVANSNRADYRIAAQFMSSQLPLSELIKNEQLIDRIMSNDETWMNVVLYIRNEAKNVDFNQIHVTCNFLENLANHGFNILNPTIADLYFKGKQYSKAIAKWDELVNTNHDRQYQEHKSYYSAKEETCPTTSEKIYWMSKGGKNDEILKHYSTPKDAELYMLDERARRIIFSLLIRPKTFIEALTYPYNGSDKYQLLYRSSRNLFIEHYVLNDFSESKFTEWIETPILNGDSNPFDDELPLSIFEKIFSLPRMDDWIKFMKLKDNGGYRVIRNAVNSNKVADAVCKALSEKNYPSLASCFLDVIFNSPYYNYENANKHINTLLDVFEKNEFSPRDFIQVSKKNIYFDACELTGHDLDNIKDKLRDFVKTRFATYKKIKFTDLRTAKTLCKIYEKAAPQVPDERGKFIYDHENVLAFYQSLKKRFKLPIEFVDFIEIRMAVINTRYKSRTSFSSFMNALDSDISMKDVLTALDKEDALWFIALAYGKKNVNHKELKNYGKDVAQMIYLNDITIGQFEKKEVKNNLRLNMVLLADNSIKAILAENKIDDEALKILSYLYEVFMEENSEKADKFDRLSKQQRISKLYRLVHYLHIRALHYYAYGNERRYVNKAIEYEESMSIERARELKRPNLGEVAAETTEPSPKSEQQEQRPISDQDKAKKSRRGKGNPASEKVALSNQQLKVDDMEQEVARRTQLEMARKLKKNGVAIDIIRISAPLLTLEDIKRL